MVTDVSNLSCYEVVSECPVRASTEEDAMPSSCIAVKSASHFLQSVYSPFAWQLIDDFRHQYET
jgi:hypothetical protein